MKLIYNSLSQLKMIVFVGALLFSVVHYNSVSAKVEIIDSMEHIQLYSGEQLAFVQEIIPNVQDKLLNIEGHLHTDEEYIETEVFEDNRNHS